MHRFIDQGLSDDRLISANLNYWAYWAGEYPALWNGDSAMTQASDDLWSGTRLLGTLLRGIVHAPYRDLCAHSLWALLLHHRQLAATSRSSSSADGGSSRVAKPAGTKTTKPAITNVATGEPARRCSPAAAPTRISAVRLTRRRKKKAATGSSSMTSRSTRPTGNAPAGRTLNLSAFPACPRPSLGRSWNGSRTWLLYRRSPISPSCPLNVSSTCSAMPAAPLPGAPKFLDWRRAGPRPLELTQEAFEAEESRPQVDDTTAW